MRASVYRRKPIIKDDVLSSDEVAAIQGIPSIQKVEEIQEDPCIRPVISRLKSGFYDYCLYDATTADVNFAFTINERTVLVPAHKCFFAHQSAIFRQMFFGEIKDDEDIITQVKIIDATPEEFIEFAKCFYYEQTTITAVNVRALTYLTHKYNVELFEIQCKNFLNEMVQTNIVSVLWILPMSIMYNYNHLRHRCTNLIHSKGRILIECLQFTNCSLETLKSILNIQFVERDEARVFETCISWATTACELKELEPTSRENIRNELGDCFELICFERMSPAQFLQCLSKHSYMFPPDVLANIAQTVKGQQQEFDTVIVPPVVKVQHKNARFKGLRKLVKDASTADVFFTFEKASDQEEKRIAAHKCLLSAISPIFKSELMALDKSNTIHITDATFEEYSSFIKIVYGYTRLGKFHTHLSNENIEKVLILVKRYNVHCGGMLDRIENELMSIQNDKNLFWLFELSRIHSLQFLHLLCINQIKERPVSSIFSSSAFLNLCQESFKTVFSLVLNKCDASTVCDVGMKWAGAFCARNNLSNSGENIRMALGDIWHMIPFANLEPVEFIRYRRDLGDIFPSEQIKMIIDTMANEYETESDTNTDESETAMIVEENSDSNDSIMEFDDEVSLNDDTESSDESSLEDDTISESELESVRSENAKMQSEQSE